MKYPLDPKAELFIWGPVPMKFILAYSDCFKGMMLDFPKLFPGYFWPKSLLITKGPQLAWLNEQKELYDQGGKLFLDRMLPRDLREKAREEWNKACDDLRTIERAIETAKFSAFSDEELIGLWRRFHEFVDAFWAHSILPELANYGSADVLQRRLERHVPQDYIGNAMEVLSAPTGLSFYQEEEIDLSETNDMEAHQKKYFWLRNSYVNVEVLPVSFFAERKKELPANYKESVMQRLASAIEQKRQVQAQYSLPHEILDIGEGIADGIVWQDARKKEIWIYLHYEDLLIQEISRRTGIKSDRVKLLTSYEAEDLLRKRLTIGDYDWRAKGVALYFAHDGTMRIESTELAAQYWKLYVDKEAEKNISEFKGVVASKGAGVVHGKVRIVLDAHGAPELARDEVLVTTMTTPEYVFLMKKAAAIVTDTGGLTSHAAIVSRELGVPCIVGTKVATRALKDGDLVEVDAIKGIVRKL